MPLRSTPDGTPLRPPAVGSGFAGGPSWRRYRHLVFTFVANDLKTRYVGSSVGLFWTVVKPLLELLTYTFVFTILLRVQFRRDLSTVANALYLFCGFVAWLAVSESVSRTGNIIRENGHLIRKVHFPPAILPVYVCLSEAVNQLLRLAILILAVLAAGGRLSWQVAWVPLILALQIAFTCGLCLLVSCAAVYFKDVVTVLPSALMIWMFVTPVFYPAALYARPYQAVLVGNPLSHLVSMYRAVLLDQVGPGAGELFVFAGAAGVMLAAGLLIFHRHSFQFADLV